MKKYLLFESLSESLLNKASKKQSFKGASKPIRSSGWKHLTFLFMFMFAMLGSYAQTNGVPYTTTGNGTWTCPAGVTSVTVECWGGGGSGGGLTYNASTSICVSGGGGAGGSYVKYTVSVTPGNVYNFTVGVGAAAATGAGGAGGSTYFGNTTAGVSTGASILATGGAGGATETGVGTYGGTGNNVGNIFIGGAAGGVGSTTGNIPSSGATINSAGTSGNASTGGSQSSAGAGVAGGAGYSGAGGAGAGSGGAGGAQVNNSGSSTAGNAGTAPGGGGSGASISKSSKSGGAGGNGQIKLTWSVGPTVNDPATFTATAASTSQINLAATANGNGNNIVVVYSTSNSFTAPTNGSAAPSSGSFAGGTVFYNGSASGLGNQTGLTSGTTYYYKAFSYDGSNNFSAGFAASATTSTSVSNPATFTATVDGTTPTFKIDFAATANGSGNNIVVVYNTTGTFGTPTGGSAAPSSGSYISGTVLYNGAASGFNGTSQTGLLSGTTYYYDAFSYDGSNNFSSGSTASATTSTVAIPAAFTATDDGTSPTSQIDLAATANASSNNIVVVYSTTNSFTTPTNGSAAPSSGSYLGGTVFYNGTASGLGNQTGLSAGTTYYYEAFSYDAANNFSAAKTANASTTAGAPTVSSISPTSVYFNGNNGGAPSVITVTGTNFISTSVVYLNGSSTGVTTTFVSSTQLTASITAATVSALSSTSATISVYTSGGGTSSTQALTISVTPVITGVVPSSVAAGSSATTITVYGNNFSSGAQITWGGTPLTTTYTAATSSTSAYYTAAYLTATVPATDLLAIGATAVGVTQTQLSTTASSSTINFTVATDVVTFNTAGNNTWTCPAGVTSITVGSWGAGGGGGYGVYEYASGGSGAGGSFIQSTISVTPGQTYNLTVGTGGAGGDSLSGIPTTDGGQGGSSYFGNSTAGSPTGASLLAVGGNGGLSTHVTGTSSAHNTAAGGAAVSTGNSTTGTLIASLYGSAGGSAAGSSWTSAAGNGANGGTGGAGAPTGTSNVGSNGNAPGGGGSGGNDKTGSFASYNEFGGNGAAGQIQILYSLPSSVTNSTLTASAQVGSPATTYTITGSNVPTSFNATGLPPGLSVNTSTGAITGTPTDVSGSPYSVTLYASNGVSGGSTETLIYTITALPGITSGSTVTGKVGTTYTSGSPLYTTTASNSPTSFTLASGSMPTGLTFNSNGTITGTPASGTFGVYTLSIYATNGSGNGPASTVTLTILDVPTTSSVDPIDALNGGSSFTINVYGTNLSTLSTVTWNGTALTTTYVSPTQLSATVPSGNIAAAYAGNTAQIGVTTTGVSTASNTQPFIIDNLSTTFTSTGNTTWTCPAGVTLVTVKAWGGGGAGGGSTSSSYNLGGGGAGGSYVEYKATVVPGTTYNLTVGAGGTGVSASNGNAGGSSYFGNTIAGNPASAVVLATGGAGGTGATGTNSSSNFGGGFAGGVGSTSGNIPSSGAYYDFAGTSGQTSVGGATAGAYAGAGGTGAGPGGSANGGAGGAYIPASGSSTAGHAGTAPSGGGSGSLSALTNEAGGAGGAGEVALIYNAAPVITNTLTASGTAGQLFKDTIRGLYSPTSFGATGLPSGLSILNDSIISGTLASNSAGDYTVTISATNGAGTGSASLVLTVNNPGAPTITSGSTVSGSLGVYSANLYQIAASATYPATIASYAATGLPAGLLLNPSNGKIYGTPAVSGTIYTVVKAYDNYGDSAHITITFTIAPAPNYYYSGSGALNSYLNWYTSTNGNGIQAASSAVFTQTGTNFNILTNATTSADGGTWTVNGTGSYIVVGSSTTNPVTVTVVNGNNIVGLVNVNAALYGSNTLHISDATIPTFNTLNAGSTVVYDGTSAQTIYTATYGNLTISNTAGVTTSAQSAITVAGQLTVSSGSTLTLPSATTTSISVSGGVVVNGTVVFPAGYTTYISGSSAFTVNSGGVIYVGDALGIASSTTTGNIRTTTTSRSLSAGSYVYDASVAQVTGAGLTGCVNLTINDAGSTGADTVKISSALSVTGTLTVSAGVLACGSDLLTLKSTSIANTAVVAPVVGSITGTATVERYIPAGYRGYRDLAPQVYNSSYTTGNIFTNWQEGGSLTHNGYGIFITGPTSTDATLADYASGQKAANSSTGLDYSLNGISSAFTYNNTNGSFYSQFASGKIDSIINTKTTNLDVFTGYRVLVRGDRSFNLATTPILNYPAGLRMYNPTTVRATGNLVYGTVTYSTTGVTGTANGSAITSTNALNTNAAVISGGKIIQGLSMVTNPYACPVSWTSVYNNSVSAGSNINGTWYFLDPTYGATGSYEGYNYSTGSQFSDEANASDLIQAGQAFFVLNATTSPTPKVVFEESAKQATSTKLSIFGASAPLSKIYVELYNGTTRTDGAAVAFRNDFTNDKVGSQDAYKLGAGNDNISVSDKGVELGIDGRLPATASDAIALKIGSPTATSYQLKVDATRYIDNGVTPLLYDAYKNTTTALGSAVTTVNFTVDANTAASYANRFSIVFQPSALAVNSIVASATLSNKVATITWNTVGEKGESYYSVEKSTDGKNFTAIGQQAAKNTSTASYTATDNDAVATTNYYRIKAVSETGSVNYSNIAKVQLTVNSNQFTVYPNPLVGKTLNVSLGNVAAGKYVVSIYNVLGEKVNEQTISHSGGSATHAITINNTLAGGVYSLVIREAGSNQIVHQSNLSVQP